MKDNFFILQTVVFVSYILGTLHLREFISTTRCRDLLQLFALDVVDLMKIFLGSRYRFIYPRRLFSLSNLSCENYDQMKYKIYIDHFSINVLRCNLKKQFKIYREGLIP